jgi:hypothetical protein
LYKEKMIMWQKLSVFTVFAFVLLLGGNIFSAKGQDASPQGLDPASISTVAQSQPSFFVALNTFGFAHAFDISAQAGLTRYQVNTPENGDLRLVEAAVGDFTGDKICDVMAFDDNKNLHRFVAGNDRRFTSQLVLANALPAADFYISSKIGDTAVGDFNGDGHLDFAVSGAHCDDPPCEGMDASMVGIGLVHIFLNQGNGNFTRAYSFDFEQFDERQYERIAGLGAADYNGDGKLDLFIQHYWNSDNNPTYVAINNTPANSSTVDFSEPTQLFTNPHDGGTNALAVGDFDKDGILDLVVGQDNDEPAGRTWFYKGLSNGSFEFVDVAYDTNPTTAAGGQGLADVYDFNGDGNLDIVASAENLGVYLFLGSGDGTFQSRLPLYDADGAWFKISTPPLGSECFWNEAAATPHIYLPFLMR